jgi:intracellular septation protein A
MPAVEPQPLQAPARPSRMKILGGIFEGFGPLIVFYACEHLWGLLAAIISGIAVGGVLVAWQVVKERRVSSLTAFMAASVLIFGGLDLRYQTGFFVKLEPALGNTACGLFLLGSIALDRGVFANLAERYSGRSLAAWQRKMLFRLTLVWGVFFLLRALGFVWMAYHLTVDQAMFWRATLGNAAYGVVIAAGAIYARLCRLRAMKDTTRAS